MTSLVYERHGITVHEGDCLDVLRSMPDASVHAIVTDPPYGLEFMGREWDTFKPSNARIRTRVDGRTNPASGKSVTTTPEAYVAGHPFQAWCEAWAIECLRVLKPGGHLAAFGGTRTYHRLACGIEDAGFEIRDSIGAGLMAWAYGSGFPKSLDVGKAIDKAAGAEREVTGREPRRVSPRAMTPNGAEMRSVDPGLRRDAPATDAAREWDGWGTALKPAWEPVILARKPLSRTVAANVLEHGTGGINVDACRVEGGERPHIHNLGGKSETWGGKNGSVSLGTTSEGRWPANVVLCHTETCGEVCAAGCPVAELDRQTGTLTSGVLAAHHARAPKDAGILGAYGSAEGERGYGDTGGGSRFFPIFRYEAKAPTAERPKLNGKAHPTVKPLDLMRWLVRLLTPPGGVVLDCFAGTGTTLHAARAEGFRAIGIERDPESIPLIVSRLDGYREPSPVDPQTGLVEPVDLLDLLDGGAA